MANMAQMLYEAYGEEVGWVNYQGKPMPDWDQLTEKVQNGWHAVATKAAEMLI